jgi:hypothetical protein
MHNFLGFAVQNKPNCRSKPFFLLTGAVKPKIKLYFKLFKWAQTTIQPNMLSSCTFWSSVCFNLSLACSIQADFQRKKMLQYCNFSIRNIITLKDNKELLREVNILNRVAISALLSGAILYSGRTVPFQYSKSIYNVEG